MIRDILTDFAALKGHVKGSGLKYHDALVDYFKVVGERQGFTVMKDSTVIRGAHGFGKFDLVWVEPNVIFQSEFGVLDDIFRHLWRIMAFKPAVAVLLLSGMSQCSPRKVKELVDRSPQLKGIEFVILDVSAGKAL
jgi:hypothetical protein